MRLLFTSWPAWGHLLAMYPLARAAQQAGHTVVFASGADVTDGLQRDGFPTWAVGLTRMQGVAARRPAEEPDQPGPWEQRVTADVHDLFAPASVSRAEEMLPLAQAWCPDIMVRGTGDASGPVVAAALGVPSVMHGLSVMPLDVAMLLSPLMSTVGQRFGLPDLDRRVLDGPVVDITPASMLPSGSGGLPDRQPLRPSAGEVDSARDVAASIASLPFERTVYLTLGTIVNTAPGVMETALTGILGCRANIVVTTGPGFDVARLGNPPAHVLVREHIGQATVFAHCSAVVSHAGSGTMLGALSWGLPQLALPMGADQPFNAEALERIGAGLRREPTALTAESVRDAVMRLLDDPSFTTAAQEVQAEIAGMPTPSEVMRLLERRLVAAR